MNVGLILTPVSIYQMSRGALVLWVGILSVIFLRRRLFLYQWASLVIVMLGVCIVGLSGSLVKKDQEIVVPGDGGGSQFGLRAIVERASDDPARVAFGVLLILFAQIFTAIQYVSRPPAQIGTDLQVVEEKIMSRYKVEPLVSIILRRP
jgi:drug/metabolite transporter (DMT)-like permease